MDQLSQYKIIQTEDGSTTLFSKKFNEACHSTSGARSETKLHYIQGCAVPELAEQKKEIFVLEVGFGTGLGFEETLSTCSGYKCYLHFHSFEIDDELFIYFCKKRNLSFEQTNDFFQVKGESFQLTCWRGDARQSIKKIKQDNLKFDCVYQDAFSPKRNAILWTTEWFKDLGQVVTPEAILSTYSSSSSIRKSLLCAGWKVRKGEKFGPKRSSTRATLAGESDQEILDHLQRSPAPELTDNNYHEYVLRG